MKGLIPGVVGAINVGGSVPYFVTFTPEVEALAFTSAPVTVAYSAAPIILGALGQNFLLLPTDGVAFVLGAPTNLRNGQWIMLTVRNATGGALGAMTFNAVFKSPAWVQPATGFSRSVLWVFNGTNLVERVRSAADIPN